MKKKELLKRIEALERLVIKPKGFSCEDMSDVLDGMQQITCDTDKDKKYHFYFAEDYFNEKAEKFKEIADHANAINDIIKSAPE